MSDEALNEKLGIEDLQSLIILKITSLLYDLILEGKLSDTALSTILPQVAELTKLADLLVGGESV